MKKKNIIIIVTIILLLIVAGVATTFVLKTKKSIPTSSNSVETMLNSAKEIKSDVATDKIILEPTTNIDTASKVHLWIFSDPIDLGEFSITKEGNTYYLENVDTILKTKNIKSGSHRILIIQNDKTIGYIKVVLTKDKTLKVTITEDEQDEETTKEEENTSNTQTNNNQTTEQPKEEIAPTQPVQEEIKCTPKKFKNKYTYVYTEKEVCIKNGDQIDAWNYFKANNIPATTYGCEEIIDECGDTYYGVYYGNTLGEKFYY